MGFQPSQARFSLQHYSSGILDPLDRIAPTRYPRSHSRAVRSSCRCHGLRANSRRRSYSLELSFAFRPAMEASKCAGSTPATSTSEEADAQRASASSVPSCEFRVASAAPSLRIVACGSINSCTPPIQCRPWSNKGVVSNQQHQRTRWASFHLLGKAWLRQM